jgi:hypothetical protein
VTDVSDPQVRVESSGNYLPVSTYNDTIPASNGFFVQVSSATNKLKIPKSARAHSVKQSNFKNVAGNKNDNALVIKVTNDGNSFYDINKIGFKEDATEAWDVRYDSHKLWGNSKAPQLWTRLNDENFSVNFINKQKEPMQIPLNFKAGINSQYHITVEGVDSFENGTEIYLEDLFTGQTINLKENPVYDFEATTEDDQNRFVVHFYGVTGIDQPEEAADNTFIYAYNDKIYFGFKKVPLNKVELNIFNLMGQNIYREKISPSSLNVVNANLEQGVYIVKVESGDQTSVSKVVLR